MSLIRRSAKTCGRLRRSRESSPLRHQSPLALGSQRATDGSQSSAPYLDPDGRHWLPLPRRTEKDLFSRSRVGDAARVDQRDEMISYWAFLSAKLSTMYAPALAHDGAGAPVGPETGSPARPPPWFAVLR